MYAAEARRAGAGVAVDAVGAVGAVLARVALALVDVLLALGAPEAWRAGAHEAVHLVLTETPVAARVWCWAGEGRGGRGERDVGVSLALCPRRTLLSTHHTMGFLVSFCLELFPPRALKSKRDVWQKEVMVDECQNYTRDFYQSVTMKERMYGKEDRTDLF